MLHCSGNRWASQTTSTVPAQLPSATCRLGASESGGHSLLADVPRLDLHLAGVLAMVAAVPQSLVGEAVGPDVLAARAARQDGVLHPGVWNKGVASMVKMCMLTQLCQQMTSTRLARLCKHAGMHPSSTSGSAVGLEGAGCAYVAALDLLGVRHDLAGVGQLQQEETAPGEDQGGLGEASKAAERRCKGGSRSCLAAGALGCCPRRPVRGLTSPRLIRSLVTRGRRMAKASLAYCKPDWQGGREGHVSGCRRRLAGSIGLG